MPVWSARDLLHLNRRQLIGFMKDGHPIEASSLENFEYRGVSLGLPELVERLTWKKFKKVFHRDRATGLLRGWNVRLDQNGLDAPWVPLTRNEVPVTFGHFRVVSGAGYRMPEPCAQGLVLDYGLGGNRRREGLSLMRDPVVAVNAGSAELLLGWTYLDLPFAPVGTPSFFTLERDCPLTHVHLPPRRPPAR
ncbi:MAG: hypothetical protein ACYC8T_09210 [Myxococcaceae bacterium]